MVQAVEQLRAQTASGRRLVAVLYDEADWLTRDQIALRLGKNRLNPHDITLLERLGAGGLVDIRKRDHPGRIGFEFIYRLKADVHRGLNLARQYRRERVQPGAGGPH
jgi:hypothetical protein